MTEIVSVESFEETVDLDNVPETYQQFRDQEGIPVHRGLTISDWQTVETGPWERTGQYGAFINLYGSEGVNDLHVHDIEPYDETDQLHYLFGQLVYVVNGSGVTSLGDDELIFEWDTGALFFLPPGTPYQLMNSTDEVVRLLAITPLPQLMNQYPVPDVILSPDSNWLERYRAEARYSGNAKLKIYGDDMPEKFRGNAYWDANFIPDMRGFDKLKRNSLRGAGGSTVIFPMPASGMHAHISEFPAGTYKKAHRHHPGANIGVLNGEGYTLMWREEWDHKIRINWEQGSLFTPPAHWYHQHFNLGSNPARYFALHGAPLGTLDKFGTFDSGLPENQIEYTEEDPDIRELYRRELKQRNREFSMPEQCYRDPNYDFSTGTTD